MIEGTLPFGMTIQMQPDRLIELFSQAAARKTAEERERFLEEVGREDPTLREQVMSLQVDLSQTEGSIAAEEAAMNQALYRLYALTKGEIALVEKDRLAALA